MRQPSALVVLIGSLAASASAQVTVTSATRNFMAFTVSDDPDRAADLHTLQRTTDGLAWETSQTGFEIASLTPQAPSLATTYAYFNSGAEFSTPGQLVIYGVGELAGSARATNPIGTSAFGGGLGWTVEFEVASLQQFTLSGTLNGYRFDSASGQTHVQFDWTLLLFRIVDGEWEATVGGREGRLLGGPNSESIEHTGQLQPGRYALAAGMFCDVRSQGEPMFANALLTFSFALPTPSASTVPICAALFLARRPRRPARIGGGPDLHIFTR